MGAQVADLAPNPREMRLGAKTRAVLSDKPVAAATATAANKFHHSFTKSDDDGFLHCEGDAFSVVIASNSLGLLLVQIAMIVRFWDDLHGTLLQSHSCHKGDVNALAQLQVISRCFLLVLIARYSPMLGDKVKRKRGSEKPINFSYNKWAHLAVPMLISAGDDTKLFAYSTQEFTKFAPRDICPAPQRLPIQLAFGTLACGSSLGNSYDAKSFVQMECELYMWGRDEGDGRLGLGAGRGPNEGGGLSIPSKVNVLPASVAAVSCGGFFTMAITEDGKLWNWGGQWLNAY
ncbi:hypothetical protein Syun_029501 [Stephania yunnanensis]|uniref:Uncharacterized protein n=1 Tax=Stephania yunnanensis TaxID=152371 RepID=A0AAP0EA41_9MAGN